MTETPFSFWLELFRLQGTHLNLSTSNHPQADGQTEAMSQTLEDYLRWFTGEKPKEWTKWLSLVEYWYNTS